MTFTDSYALRVLQWVSFAARPLHIDELKEAVAFNMEDTVWDAGKIPQADVVIGCGANLVAIDPSDQCVRFAHPSIKAFLQKDSKSASLIPGYTKSEKQGELQCGEFCVTYLSFSNFNLGLVKPANEIELVKVPDPKLLAGDALPSSLVRFFWGRGTNRTTRPNQIQFRRIRSATIPDRSQYKFLDYAVTHWTLQTQKITYQSPVWERFKQLSLTLNETWDFHPWKVGGRSQTSRLHGLFGWAVKKEHIPLLRLALISDRDIREICNLPLIDERLPALHVASKMGLADVVELLLPLCQLNLQDEEGYTALHHAAGKGHIGVVTMLLQSASLKVDILCKTLVTPLWLAADHGHCDVVRALAERKANLEARGGPTRRTVLSQAASKGHRAVVEFLVDRGVNLEATDTDGWTPLSWAITNDHMDTVELLLLRGANSVPEFRNQGHLLLWAVQTGHAPLVGLLIRNPQTDLNARDDNGLTALWWAVRNRQFSISKILLEPDLGRRVNLEVRDAEGQTPLLCAVRNSDERMTGLLLRRGANISARDKHKRTAIFWAVENNQEDMINLLLGHSGTQANVLLDFIASRTVQLQTNDTVKISPSINGHFQYPKSLSAVQKSYEWPIQRRAELDSTIDREGLLRDVAFLWSTADGQDALVEILSGSKERVDTLNRSLIVAAAQGTEDLANLLLVEGADICATNVDGQSPLWWAARNGHTALVNNLYHKGGHIDSEDKFGLTPLAWAVENDHWSVIKLLVRWGANIRASDKSGQTPLSRAKAKGTQSLLLKQWKGKSRRAFS